MAVARFYVIAPDSSFAGKSGYFELLGKLCTRLLTESRVCILSDESTLETIDAGLWAHPPTGFVPHCSVGQLQAEDLTTKAVELTADLSRIDSGCAVINLSQQPLIEPKFDNLIELVRPNTPSKQRGRRHFEAYKQAGFDLKHFTV